MIRIRTRPPENRQQPPASIYDERLTEAVRRMQRDPCCDEVAWPVTRGVAVVGHTEVGGDLTSVCLRCASRRLVNQYGVVGWRARGAPRGPRLVNPAARRAALDESLGFLTLGIEGRRVRYFQRLHAAAISPGALLPAGPRGRRAMTRQQRRRLARAMPDSRPPQYNADGSMSLTVTRRNADEALSGRHDLGHMWPIFKAVRERRLLLAIWGNQSGRHQRFDPARHARGRPFLPIVGDDMEAGAEGRGPSAYHPEDLRRLISGARHVAILPRDPITAIYARMTDLAVAMVPAVVVETTPEREAEWIGYVTETAPGAELVLPSVKGRPII